MQRKQHLFENRNQNSGKFQKGLLKGKKGKKKRNILPHLCYFWGENKLPHHENMIGEKKVEC